MTRSLSTLTALLGAALLSACAATHRPLFMDTDFQPEKGTAIALMPVLDARCDTSQALDVEGAVRQRMLAALEERGYVVVDAQFAGEPAPLNESDATVDPALLATLGPRDAQVVLVVRLDDAHCDSGLFHNTFKAEVTGFAWRGADGRLLWHDRVVAQDGQGGLISHLFDFQAEVIGDCLSSLACGLPEPGKRHPAPQGGS